MRTYVRQSTLLQVRVHTESLARQYDLRQRAAGLGWPAHQVVVIDEDLGRSGASAAGRGLCRGEQRVAVLVARARDEPADGHQQGAVVRPQREHRGVHTGAGQEFLKLARVRHR
jgi:hypothetical protein